MKHPEAMKILDDLAKHLVMDMQAKGSLKTALFIVSGYETRVIDTFDPNSSEQKSVAAEMARYIAKKYNADFIIMGYESFMILQEGASKEDIDNLKAYRQKHGTLEGHPLTFEAINLSIETEDSHFLRYYPFSWEGKKVVVGEPRDTPFDGKSYGVLTNLLDPKKNLPVPDDYLEQGNRPPIVKTIKTRDIGIQNDKSKTKH